MNRRLLQFQQIVLAYIFLDIYCFFGLNSLFSGKSRLLYQLVYILSSILVYYSFYQFYQAMIARNIFSNAKSNIYLGIIITAIVSKLVLGGLFLIQDFGRILLSIVNLFKLMISGRESLPGPVMPARRRMLTLISTGIAAIPFASLLYGITRGKYAYTVNTVKLNYPDLPKAFDGFRIVQISDIHAGSLDNVAAVAKGIKMINEQNPDLILFTGDMVNSKKNEVDPFIDTFNALTSKYGNFAVLGNHDYYGVPDTNAAAYWADFKDKFKAMGFDLLKNENRQIEKDGQFFNLIGVENWGRAGWAPKQGDLNKALGSTQENEFNILMSHDPTHWDDKVLRHPRHIHLTLSGHTHGFQFGIKMPGFKWSPAQYTFDRWQGLYEEKKQYLYINTGFGFLTFPGRVGMWPEITVIDLAVA